jgi:hypothetical protein
MSLLNDIKGSEYGSTLGSYPEAEFKEKHGVWDPMLELTKTLPYFIVDSKVQTIAEFEDT